jgi:multiple sugar transport system permease protein/raffinose/stachyose/melibiose transport system permease protein
LTGIIATKATATGSITNRPNPWRRRLPPALFQPGTGGDTSGASWLVLLLFLGPALLVFATMTAYPMVRTVYDSFYTIDDPDKPQFIGLANYAQLVTDATFWRAVGNTLIWSVAAPLLDVGIGLLLALCLYAKVPFTRFLRVAWFTPVLLSYVVVAIVWLWIYNYDWGIVNLGLRAVGLGFLASAWLGNPHIALASLIFIDVWKWAGFNMVVCLAALHSLPSEVLEAAELDNCGWGAKLRFVIVPLLRPTLLNLYILAFVAKMKVFDLVWIMTQGGPLWSTETVSTYVYKRAFAWNTFDLGYPATIASVWFAVVILTVLLLNRILRARDRVEF